MKISPSFDLKFPYQMFGKRQWKILISSNCPGSNPWDTKGEHNKCCEGEVYGYYLSIVAFEIII